jgi:endonuclease/exonuclease/phosphatase family metal-dependent hydrolase
MNRLFLSGFITLFFSCLQAQDTLTVMQYNLLYYGVNTEFCTAENNSISTKDPALKKILNEVQPDIFTVNELSSSVSVHSHLLDEVLNTNSLKTYEKANYDPYVTSDICSMLFYNSSKLRIARQAIAQSLVRDINLYELYYLSDDLTQGDTAFVICIVGHLKAGNTSADESTRSTMVSLTMQFLENGYQSENLLFMGDFNYYTAFEPGFQKMINYSNPDLRFFDPANSMGSWNNNSAYTDVHTQSTHTSSNGCPSTGGMDDRFDFILASGEVMDGEQYVRYIQGSYHAFGQDGNRFNGTVNGSPANTSVSQQVADALYTMSDHLPVVMKLKVDKTLDVHERPGNPFRVLVSPNPVSAGNAQIKLEFSGFFSEEYQLEIIDLQGHNIRSTSFIPSSGNSTLRLNLTGLNAGIYLLKIRSEGKAPLVQRFIVTN